MMRIESGTRPAAARHETSQVTLRHMCGGARWMASFREPGHDSLSTLRPEDVARGEVFFSSTGCWV